MAGFAPLPWSFRKAVGVGQTSALGYSASVHRLVPGGHLNGVSSFFPVTSAVDYLAAFLLSPVYG